MWYELEKCLFNCINRTSEECCSETSRGSFRQMLGFGADIFHDQKETTVTYIEKL